MKLGFKKLCCMALALLFSFNLANVSLSVKAAPTSSVTEKGTAFVQSDERGNIVLTKEMFQEIVDQHLGKASKSEKSAAVTFLLALFLGDIGAHQFYVGNIGTGVAYLCFNVGLAFVCPPLATLVGITIHTVDALRVACGSFKDSKGLPVQF